MSESKKRPIVLSTTPGWMVTYADMMALLLCLFVLLLSFSDIDSTSFQQNAGPIREAFNPSVIIPSNKPTLPSRVFIPPVVEPQEQKIRPEDTRIAEMLREDMRVEIENKAMELDMTEDRIIIRFPGRAAFPSGSATLQEDFLPVIDKIRALVARTKGQVIVSGHTDDTPITTGVFRSNWDLSTARAVSVVHELLADPKIDPSRLTAQGFGASRPLVPNDTPEGRARNRRVEISIDPAENQILD